MTCQVLCSEKKPIPRPTRRGPSPDKPQLGRQRREELFAILPPPWPERDLLARVWEATLASGRKVVVLDDDPTGTQTVHGVPVLARAWDEASTTRPFNQGRI